MSIKKFHVGSVGMEFNFYNFGFESIERNPNFEIPYENFIRAITSYENIFVTGGFDNTLYFVKFGESTPFQKVETNGSIYSILNFDKNKLFCSYGNKFIFID